MEVDPEEQERIRKRQAGTAVTIETFLKWREAFETEERLRLLQSSKGGVSTGNLEDKVRQ